MPPSRRSAPLLLLAAAVLCACADTPTAPPSADREEAALALAGAPEPVPTRAEERPGTFADMSDRELWSFIEYADRTAVVGLKAPDAVRGVYRGRILIGHGQLSQARQAVAMPRGGVRVLAVDPLLPIVEVRIESFAHLRALRRMSVVDYVEPTRAPEFLPAWASTGGCGWPGAWGGDWLTTPSGDGHSVRFSAMRIPDAWSAGPAGAPVNGAGVTVGLTDTGVASSQAELRGEFAGGSVPTRTVRHLFLSKFGSANDECGHGTRMAGVIAAPDDGRGVVGVAWGANLVSVRQANGVANVATSDARASVRAAAQNQARIVTMAWQSMNWWWQLSDEIRWWHYNRDVLFLGAAGTSGCGDLIPDNNVVFPAEMSEVVAVTGVSYPDLRIPCGIHYGGQVELTAFLDVPTTGQATGFVTSIGGSSNATAIVAGIAALVWQANPGMSRDAVRARLQQSGAFFPVRHNRMGFGLVDAYRAVTGVSSSAVDGA